MGSLKLAVSKPPCRSNSCADEHRVDHLESFQVNCKLLEHNTVADVDTAGHLQCPTCCQQTDKAYTSQAVRVQCRMTMMMPIAAMRGTTILLA